MTRLTGAFSFAEALSLRGEHEPADPKTDYGKRWGTRAAWPAVDRRKLGKSMTTRYSGLVTLCVALSFHISYAAEGRGTVAVPQGNVVYTAPGGATQVLTETGADDHPVLSPDGRLIAFTRLTREGNNQDGDPPVRDLWVIRVDGLKATKLVTGKPEGNEDPQQVLAGIDHPAFSPEGSTVYFMTAAWVTSSAIHAVPSAGGPQRYVTSGNSLSVVRRGKYAGALMVVQHRYMDGHGSWNPQVLVSPAGKKIKVVGEGPRALQSVESER